MNNTLLPNHKMTKSYLLESDPYLKTSSKSTSFAMNTDDHVYCSSDWNSEPSDRPVVKPLTLHNLPSNAPPIAYVNGNSVRAIRSRHYSQQQTVLHQQHNTSNSSDNASDSCINTDGDTHQYAASSEDSVNENTEHHSIENGFKFATSLSTSSTKAPKSLKVKVQSTNSNHQPSSPSKAQAQQPSLRDYVTNSEYESTNYNDNIKQVIEHLAKQIEGVLRMAKESRRLICSELLVPHMLTAHIAHDVIEMAECEPCGLRGCLLFICIEDNQHSKLKSPSSNSHQKNSPNCLTPISSRLLGEFAIDPSVVPTFEVFLTLKRAAPNWFESIEHIILGKERIVLSEVYLLHKKKLYQPSSPTL